VQIAHRIDGAEIEILAKDEGVPDLLQFLVAASGQGSRLDPGIALPFAALGDEVVLQHVEGASQRPRFAVGPQSHIDAKDLTVFGHLGNGIDQAASEAGEKLEVGN